MISVRGQEDDKVQALEAGADDYVTKPFRYRELLARLRAVYRRTHSQEAEAPTTLRAGSLELSLEDRLLRKDGKEVHLSQREFDILAYLMRHPNAPIPHARLLQAVWGPEYGGELEYLRTYIRHLRKKLEQDPAHPEYLLTEPWVGYRFCNPVYPDTSLE
jgi:two-component system KDP operon response regulator KdpE